MNYADMTGQAFCDAIYDMHGRIRQACDSMAEDIQSRRAGDVMDDIEHLLDRADNSTNKFERDVMRLAALSMWAVGPRIIYTALTGPEEE